MSEVFARNKSETELQFRVNAENLQVELSKYVMKEKVLPKKWRYAIGYPLISKVDELVDNITYANSFYPEDETELKKRKLYQTLAIANCFQIQNKLIRMLKCVEKTNVKQIENIIKRLTHEVDLLIAWRKNSKIIKK
jgi:chromosome condensin MukBEF complex kleisin-like MukF subunit